MLPKGLQRNMRKEYNVSEANTRPNLSAVAFRWHQEPSHVERGAVEKAVQHH